MLTAPDGEPSTKDLEAHDLVHVCQDDLVDKFQTVDGMKVCNKGADMLTGFECFESEDDKAYWRDVIHELQ